jgi:hypothetical protein
VRRLSTLALGGLAVLCVARCGSGQGGPCLAVPQTFPQNRLVPAGATVHAPVGAVLWVALVESANYSATRYPRSFPWLKPISSDQGVLRPVRLCRLRGMYSLPETITAFRSVGSGQATLLAKLAPPWRGRTHRLRSYRATVIVGH